MQVQASVDEADIGNVGKGQRVVFTVDAFPEDTFSGRVKEIRLQPSTSANVVSYTTLIDAPNSDKRLKPGMTASIFIYTKEIEHALLVSASAFSFEPDTLLKKLYRIERHAGSPPANRDSGQHKTGKPGYVWIKKDSALILHAVLTGMTNETQREIVSGLSTEDEVVTGYEKLKGKATAKSTSPFMPQRPGGRGTGGGGGTRQPR